MHEKIVFFGSGKFIVPVIEILNESFDLTLVVTTEKNQNDPVVKFCNLNSIPLLTVAKFTEEHIMVIEKRKARIGVLASFGIIVPDNLLSIFEFGIINIHPSLLPKYRGPTPVQSAILNGETTTGVSIIKLDSEIDHGPILGIIDHKIEALDTAESLYKKLFVLGADFIRHALPNYLSGELKPFEQNHSQATFTDHLTRESGFIDLSSLEISNSKLEITRKIRAFYPWPGVWFRTKLNGIERIIKLLPGDPAEREVASLRIQVEGKSVMKLSDFANGYPEGKEIIDRLNLS